MEIVFVISIVISYFFFFILLLGDKEKSKMKKCIKFLYTIFFIIILVGAICLLSQSTFPPYYNVLWVLSTILFLYVIRFWYFLINIGKNRYLISLKVLLAIFVEYFMLSYVCILWLICSIALICVPKEEYFIVVTIFTSLIPSWLCWRKKDIKLIFIFLPTIFAVYIFVLGVLSLIRGFCLFYQTNELLIFICLSYFLISQSVLDERFMDFFGLNRVLNIVLKKSFIRFAILLLTNIAALTSKEMEFVRSVNMGILLSLAFDSFIKDIEKSNKIKFKEKYINEFKLDHQYAVCKFSEVDYIIYMSKKYGKMKVSDVGYIDEGILDYFLNNYAKYMPSVPFAYYVTIGCMCQSVLHTNYFWVIKYLFVHLKGKIYKLLQYIVSHNLFNRLKKGKRNKGDEKKDNVNK